MIPRRILSPGLRPAAGRSVPTCWPGLGLQSTRKPTRPAAAPIGMCAARAWQTTVTGEQKSGHIKSAPNESILFFGNLSPLKLSTLLRRPWQTDRDLSDLLRKYNASALGILDPIKMVKRSIPESVPMKVTEIIPRLKDGGAFVKFNHPPEVTPTEIERTLSGLLEEKPIKPWFNPFRGIKIGLVNGVPWLEDLYRFPKSRVRIEFIPKEPGSEAVELSQETIYSLFRKYGKIAEITSQSSDSKVLPKFAFIDFVLVRDAIMARNCLHGIVVPEALGGGKAGTKLQLSYEQKVNPHHIWDWITNHPRIVIPIVAALLAAVTVAIFDPIREFFIKAHIQKAFQFSSNKIVQWFKRQTDDLRDLAFKRPKSEDAGLRTVFTHRRDVIDSIQTWLLETADTFIVVRGPRGSGKEELVIEQALGGRKDVLVIDCKPIIEARRDSTTIKKLAGEVGYRPVFSWANQLSSLIDLAVQSTTGVKSGFSETLDSQVSKILQNTAAALKTVSLSERKKDDIDAGLSDDAYLEAHPERRSVVVIENFLLKNEESSVIYDKIAEWSAALVQSNIAHVIFLTSDTSYSKPLSKSLPDRVFRSVVLGDLSPDVAKKYVLSHLSQSELFNTGPADQKEKPRNLEVQESQQMKELDEAIGVVGGRLTDLEFLARRLQTGQTPRQAVQEIIDQSASEILKLFLLPNKAEGKKYSTEQAWFMIKEIAKKESLRYNEVLLSNTFALSTTSGAENGEASLESLANSELITVQTHRGRPQTIQAGKPVYQAAFNALLQDTVLKAKMDLAVLTELAKIEAKIIEKVETELGLLGSFPRQPYETAERIDYLLAKLHTSQAKITDFEREMAGLKKILSQEA